MKHRVCITIDEATLTSIWNNMRKSSFRQRYRNKSHLFECAVQALLEEEKP